MAKLYIWSFTESYRVFEGATKDDDILLEKVALDTFKGQWKTLHIKNADEKGKKPPLGDFPATTGFVNLVSENAASKMGGIFLKFGELLPVDILDEDVNESYYIYKCTNVIDCLNKEKSDVKYSPIISGKISTIKTPVFYEEKIPEICFFTVPDKIGGDIYVTESVKELIKESRLKGMVLIEKYFDTKKPWIS